VSKGGKQFKEGRVVRYTALVAWTYHYPKSGDASIGYNKATDKADKELSYAKECITK
jgi:hypothetical protein